MVEIAMAKRGLESLKRESLSIFGSTSISLSPFPWPCVSGWSFTFDCEGTYGGGTSFRGETEVVPRLSKMFSKKGVQGTFNFLGKMAEEYPNILKLLVKDAQDIAGHGYSHQHLDGSSYNDQHLEIIKTIESIQEACGHRIRGWRSPYGTYDKTTYDILEEQKFLWTSNWSRSLWGSLPFYPVIEDHKYSLLEIPFDDVHFDAVMYRANNIPPKVVEQMWLNYARFIRRYKNLFVLLNHPVNLAEKEERELIIGSILQKLESLSDIWIASCEQITRRYELLSKIHIVVNQFKVSKKLTELSLTVKNRSNVQVDDLGVVYESPNRFTDSDSNADGIARWSFNDLVRVNIRVRIKANSERDILVLLKNK
jgi:peptidoglycan/xylan/chitin deacetylase (PgdA/CDA1 family)